MDIDGVRCSRESGIGWLTNLRLPYRHDTERSELYPFQLRPLGSALNHGSGDCRMVGGHRRTEYLAS